MENDYLQHYGIPGMKWYQRRYQNKDGTLTAAGKKRYNKEMDKLKQEERILKNKQRTQAKIDKLTAKRKEIDELKGKTSKQNDTKPKKKSIKDMTDEELTTYKNRLDLEQKVLELTQKDVDKGKKFATTVWNEAIKPSSIALGKQLVMSALTAAANKAFDMDKDSRKEYKFYTNNKKKN